MLAKKLWIGPLGLILALGVAPPAQSGALLRGDLPQDPEAAQSDLEALVEDFDNAMNAFREKYYAAQNDEERGKVYEEHYPQAAQWFERFLAIAEAVPGTDTAAEALVWIVQHDNGQSEIGKRAQSYLSNDYVLSAKLGPYCESLQGSIALDSQEFLRRVLAENPSRTVQAAATFALGKSLLQQVDVATQMQEEMPPEMRAGYEGYYGKAALDALAAADPVKLRREAEALLERVVSQYPEVEGGYGKYAEQARSELFELRNLQVGKTAPDIQGEDIDGVSFKLSDYRGKVVMLDFWGHW